MDIELENNQLRINIQDLFENMDEEKLEELAEHYLWNSSVYKNLVQSMKENLASPGFNQELYDLEKAFFTMPLEKEDESYEDEYKRNHFESDVLYTMSHIVKEIIRENAKLKAEIWKYTHAHSSLYNWILDRFGNDIAYQANRIHSNTLYEKPHDFELSYQMEKQITISEMIEEWVKAMMKKFNPETE